ncbi:MAG: monofunctional biosynthetic peptidoglycan transglycosylase [Pseudooceanicola sp.]|nr:monofunctional biosynthetic peptidoglycan transglycosylase [Pseudooceanicola sp.]
MAKAAGKTTRKKKAEPSPGRRLVRLFVRAALGIVALVVLLVVLFSVVNPPVTHTIWSEWRRLGEVEREWVPLEKIAPEMARSVVAAEDANFCNHWGFDVEAIRKAIESGGNRGASTISQQVVKNVFLWQGRSWFRKALETAMTPLVELIWSKRRIVEVYLNVAEMGEGVFGVGAAAEVFFGKTPDKLTAQEAALIAAVLPSPKERSAAKPSGAVKKRAASIRDGAATILADGRSACFEG